MHSLTIFPLKRQRFLKEFYDKIQQNYLTKYLSIIYNKKGYFATKGLQSIADFKDIILKMTKDKRFKNISIRRKLNFGKRIES